MASFWLDDPDDNPFAAPNFLVGGLAAAGSSAAPSAGTPDDSLRRGEPPLAAAMPRQRVFSQASSSAGGAAPSSVAAAAAFVCEQCGGRDCEWVEENESERLVCTTCFTECSQPLSQFSALSSSQLEYDEVLGLAAKTRRGGIVTRKTRAKRTPTSSTDPSADGRAAASSKRWPLEPLDTTVPFPDLLTCLEAFQTVLHGCTEILVPLFSPQEEVDPSDRASELHRMRILRKRRRTVHRTVRTLWNTYLSSWSEGAEKYGALHAAVRFSLRDCFAHAAAHRILVMNAIAARHGAGTAFHGPQDGADDQRGGGVGVGVGDAYDRSRPDAVPDRAPSRHPAARVEADRDQEHSDSSSDDWSSSSRSDSSNDTRPHRSRRRAIPGSERERRRQKRGSDSYIRRVLRHHRRHLPKTAPDLALWTPPTMTMAAALLWLAVSDVGTASPHRFCGWISQGVLPLVDAYAALLTPEQQKAIGPLAYAFRLDAVPTPHMLMQKSTHLAVACRLKAECARGPCIDGTVPNLGERVVEGGEPKRRRSKHRNRAFFWTQASLTWMLGQLVADCGLGQSVLDRSLRFADQLRCRGHFPDKLERVVALVVVACFLEPDWREWRYERRTLSGIPPDPMERTQTTAATVPWNADQLREMRNGPGCLGYASFLERIVLRNGTIPPAVEFVEALDRQDPAPGQDVDVERRSECGKNLDSQPSVRCYPTVCGGPPPTSGGSSTTEDRGTLDFTKIHQARARSSRLETDPQAAALVEFVAHATTVDARHVHAAIQVVLRALKEPVPDASLKEKKSSTKRLHGSTNGKSRYRRRIIK